MHLTASGVRPFKSDKYDITKHPQFKKLSDANPKNAFDIEKYVKNPNKAKLRGDLVVDEVFETKIG